MRRKLVRGDPVTEILRVAERGYDLLALGAPETGPDQDFLFGPVIDDVIRLATCPSLVFTARDSKWPPETILVPTGGGPAAASAAGLAFTIAGDARVILYHFLDPDFAPEVAAGRSTSIAVRMEIGQEIVNDLRKAGERRGVQVATEVVMGGSMTASLLDRAHRSVDLMIVGTNVRAGTQRLFLGPKVERLVRDTPCSTIVLNV
jgi:nucleotide-binding universal stress UspA family protein